MPLVTFIANLKACMACLVRWVFHFWLSIKICIDQIHEGIKQKFVQFFFFFFFFLIKKKKVAEEKCKQCLPCTSFLYFFRIPRFCQDFSDSIAPLKYRINTKINSCGEVIPSFLED